MVLLVYFIREYYNGIFNQKIKMKITVGIPAYNEEKNICTTVVLFQQKVVYMEIQMQKKNRIKFPVTHQKKMIKMQV